MIEHYRETHANVASSLTGGSGITALRKEAMDRFLELGFPTQRNEAWKYTSLRPLTRHAFQYDASTSHAVTAEEISKLALADFDCWRLVFINGRLEPALSDAVDNPGVSVRNLPDQLLQNDKHLLTELSRRTDESPQAFRLLNSAFLDNGVQISVTENAAAEKPLYLLMLSTTNSERVVCHPRLLLHAGSGSSLTVIEHYVGNAPNFTNVISDIDVAAGGQVEMYKINEEGADAIHIGGMNIRLARDGRLVHHNFALGGRLIRNDISVSLDEPGSEIELNGLYLTDGREHVDNHTRIDHRAPMTRSFEDYRGVLNNRSRAVYNGKVVVHPDAQKTDAWQSNRNLLLSADAEVDTKPELEIYADDVRCSHGATVGQLDKDALFYLLSRGLDPDTARSLLVFAFADEVIARIGISGIRKHLETRVIGWLPDASQIRGFV